MSSSLWKKFLLPLIFFIVPTTVSASGSGGVWLALFAYIGGFPVLILALLLTAFWKLFRRRGPIQTANVSSIKKERLNSYLAILAAMLGAGMWLLTNFGRGLIWSESSDRLCYQTFADSCSFVFQGNGFILGNIFILLFVVYLIFYPIIKRFATEKGILNNSVFTVFILISVALFILGLLPILSSSLLFRLPFL